ncbi:LOW QUALITY PROTEIN: hypothetical protein PoB_005934400 [Plakobranchus ocellatus]|uniref:Uncharacterized protein n=1 Tax=Plakobranchus ocellatus TaxID=259542 RepID=A0AAV4CJ54_9GAST|nr:LOW QUALITY PROTEIN: hypothetical protein PoB_005934400 [Plakobranchus ocellatus]
MVNQNGLDPPRQLGKVVNPNGLDPPDQLGPKEELDLVASEGAIGMQNQEMASGGEQSIICTGVRNVQSQEVPSGTRVMTGVARVGNMAVIGNTGIAQGAGAGATANRGPGTPVTTGVAHVGNMAVIGSTGFAQGAGAGAAAKRGGVARVGNMAVIGRTWIAQRAGAGATTKRGPGTPVTTGVARVGNVAVIGRKAPVRDPVKAAIGDVMDKKDTPTTRGLGRMG